MIKTVKSIVLQGCEPCTIKIETETKAGIGIHVVGLADVAMKECLLRVVTALQSEGYSIPGKKIIINVSPADLSKTGSAYDLPMALSIIASSEQQDLPDLDQWMVVGELGLDSSVRKVKGAVQAVIEMRKRGLKGCIIPQANVGDFMDLFDEEMPVYAVDRLQEAVSVIKDPKKAITAKEWYSLQPEKKPSKEVSLYNSWDALRGHDEAKRVVEIAAAGGHPLLMVGIPGSPKLDMAKAMTALLPPMTREESTEVAKVYSAAGIAKDVRKRPFRLPHYSSTIPALFGGGPGDDIMPGEVSLSHNGVLYISDLSMVNKYVLEALRIPLEDKMVKISRLRSMIQFPANFHLVASLNPCPCGYHGVKDRCTCSAGQRQSYFSRLSGPVYDRFTMAVNVPIPIPRDKALKCPEGEDFDSVADRVRQARERQLLRYEGTDYRTNDDVMAKDADRYFAITEEQKELIKVLITAVDPSPRSLLSILKMARTIADLSGTDEICSEHLTEAACYRVLDKIMN